MTAPNSNTIILTARCHCKSNQFTIEVPRSALPLRYALCQCDTCRHTTGNLAAGTISFPYSLGIPKPDVTNLVEYKTSENLPRYFCGTCGAHICTIEPDCWDVMTGIVDQTGDLVERLNIWSNDTGDGGLGAYFTEHKGEKVKNYCTNGREETGDIEMVTEETIRDYKNKSKIVAAAEKNEFGESNERLHCRCHCGGVDFYLTLPNPHTPGPDPNKLDKNDGFWWLAGKKYRTSICSCESCRLCSGFEINTWIYAPKANLVWNNGKPLQFNEGTLKSYESTPGTVIREFCSVCGAKVFYRAPARREPSGVLDIAPGLIVGMDSRAEEWLKWEPETGFEDDALDPEFVISINDGISKWNKEAAGTE
ncbi:hypothetical protein TWF106_007024 [Orbilia oligospora]|nr:hypothetical protein TWF788_007454 [Orbilia oligospora]KAF3213211.1 hypothetical protein TWF679_005437 [Orbilia oligospora]KAF3219601.1 hypothetical protein TWF106_007024 [Orbilia oligospora]KAF3260538.1 hypothetical protein TWF192_009819 [Orbilia oligospora]